MTPVSYESLELTLSPSTLPTAAGTLDAVNSFADSKLIFDAYAGPMGALFALKGGSALSKAATPLFVN